MITFRPKKTVKGEIHEYLYVKNRWFTISLHKLNNLPFVVKDPHDHPSKFLSVGLRGSYTEVVFQEPEGDLEVNSTFVRRAGTFHVMPLEYAHYIYDIGEPCWTLFVTWKYRGRGVRIYTEEGAMSAMEYFSKMSAMKDIKDRKVEVE
jgi:hypothetical protein